MPRAEVNGVELAYLDTDVVDDEDETTVLFVHGFPLCARMWEPQILDLGTIWRLVAPDLRGFGASTAPADPASYSVEVWADDLAALLDELEIDKAVLCGLSMGGYIAFAFARRHADRLLGLVLADTRAEPDTEEGRAKRTSQQAEIREKGTAGLVPVLTRGILAPRTVEERPELVDRVASLMDNPANGWLGALEAMKKRPDSTPDLGSIAVPTLILVGEKDTLTPPSAARAMHERIGGSKLVEIPRAGHLSNLEAPDVWNGELAAFLESL